MWCTNFILYFPRGTSTVTEPNSSSLAPILITLLSCPSSGYLSIGYKEMTHTFLKETNLYKYINPYSCSRELEHEYIKEFEKKMHAAESGKAFDESLLEKIGREIEKQEATLGNINKEEDYMTEKEQNSGSVHNNNNHKIDSNIFSRANFKTKIPLPIEKVMKIRRRLNLMSYEND